MPSNAFKYDILEPLNDLAFGERKVQVSFLLKHLNSSQGWKYFSDIAQLYPGSHTTHFTFKVCLHWPYSVINLTHLRFLSMRTLSFKCPPFNLALHVLILSNMLQLSYRMKVQPWTELYFPVSMMFAAASWNLTSHLKEKACSFWGTFSRWPLWAASLTSTDKSEVKIVLESLCHNFVPFSLHMCLFCLYNPDSFFFVLMMYSSYFGHWHRLLSLDTVQISHVTYSHASHMTCRNFQKLSHSSVKDNAL